MQIQMTAKEKQTEFIKTYLKPTLKQNGYQTAAQTWWKDKGEFFNVINLQNYSWNSKDSVDFRFNIGIALKATVRDPAKKKATYFDLVTNIDEGVFLPDRKDRMFGDNQGYSINNETVVADFVSALKHDFEFYILPRLDELNTLDDCLDFYKPFEFWYTYLSKVLKEQGDFYPR